jgi:amino acid adenylation domain-containing protein
VNTVVQGFQLSQQQKHLWALQQDGLSYEAQCVIRLEGELDPRALYDALCLVVQRWEVLRTTFRRLPAVKVPVQVVNEWVVPPWRTIDLNESAVIEELSQQEARAPFDFENGPLVRGLLLTVSARLRFLIVTLPALLADTGTLRLLFRELCDCYVESAPETDSALPYVQYAAWQQELCEDNDAEEGRRYWQRQKLSALYKQTLPGSVSGATGAVHFDAASFRLTPEVNSQLERVARQYNRTPEMWLLACWQTLLWRLTRAEEITVGSSYDGREFEELSNVPGLLARSLPVRARLSSSMPFREVLTLSERAVAEVRTWQDYFVWPREEAEVPAEAYCPFSFEFTHWPAERLDNAMFSVHKLYSNADRFHVKLACAQSDDSLLLEVKCDSSRFNRDDIVRLAGRLNTLLVCTLEDPETAIDELDILSPAEKQQLLVAFNDTHIAFAEKRCLHELFASQVEQTPDRDAVVYGQERLTYLELNERVETLAAQLRAHDVGPEVIVGLYVERGIEMIVGVLAILKAGGAYLPLDPTYPSQRIQFMLEDVRVRLLLTQRRLAQSLPECSADVLYLDEVEAGDESAVSQDPVVTPDNLAYVIYTSGSTGQPKGVMIQHRSVVNLALALRRSVYSQYAADQHLRIGLNAPLAFDASVKQLVQLLSGHTLYIVPEEFRPDAVQLRDFINENSLDAIDCTPSQLKLLLEAGLLDGPASPATVLVGGEALESTLWQSLSAHTARHFYNVYGPTECTVDATCCAVRSSQLQPSLGRPLANVQVYVLDEALRPLPIGCDGELYIGGYGLARGYLHRPELTAERFVPDPFAAVPGSRLYRTGDRARFLPDGNLEFLGRLDDQVKLHGYRIELGEIEAALARHENVRRAVVAIREEHKGVPQLVAYVVPRHVSEVLTEELRQLLRQSLPEYMVPTTFVFVDALPLTRHGKVDRNALPAPETAGKSRSNRYVAPRNEVEQIVAGIWQKALQVERIGRDDNFFDLGGHSLLMVKVHAELRAVFGEDLSIVELFKKPTVGSLAEYFANRNGQRPNLQNVHRRAERRRQAAQRRFVSRV